MYHLQSLQESVHSIHIFIFRESNLHPLVILLKVAPKTVKNMDISQNLHANLWEGLNKFFFKWTRGTLYGGVDQQK